MPYSGSVPLNSASVDLSWLLVGFTSGRLIAHLESSCVGCILPRFTGGRLASHLEHPVSDAAFLASPERPSLSRFGISGLSFFMTFPVNPLKRFMKDPVVLLNSLRVSCKVSASDKLFVRIAEGCFPERVVLGWSLPPMIWFAPMYG